MPVRKSVYRQPLSPEGIKEMENEELDYFDTTMWANFTTGTLEQYFNEKARKDSFKRSHFNWKHVIYGISIGMMFAIINQYVGLKIGMIVSGAWYMVYLTALMFKWDPIDINITAGACTGASAMCTGFVFSYPAIYLLSMHKDYAVGMEGGKEVFLISVDMLPPVWVVFLCAIFAGWLGVMYFTVFRRIWLIEDPLPMPGFEAIVKLTDIANDLSRGATEQAKKALMQVVKWSVLVGSFAFIRDWPFRSFGQESIMDHLFGGRYYSRGEVMIPYDHYTHVGVELLPMQLATGWFMRFKIAALMISGSALTWFIIVPLAVYYNYPVYIPVDDLIYGVASMNGPAFVAYGRVARVVAIGAILGGGITALIKMRKVFRTATQDMFALGGKDAERLDYIEGLGWFEWPMTQIPIMAAVLVISIPVFFGLTGFPIIASTIMAILLVFVCFFLGAIGVKVMGETRSTPVSGTSFVVLILLITLFKAIGLGTSELIVLALIGATLFGTALTLSSDIIYDFRIGIYCGTRPYHLVKGEILGIPFGAIMSIIGASIFSLGLAEGTLDLKAPQAHAFATFVQIILGPNPPYDLFIIGLLVGIWAEIMTGRGTAFGLGMYIPIPLHFPLLIGGIARDYWEKNILEPKAKAENWPEREKTLKVMETYMIAIGILIGEALMGTIVSIYMVLVLT